MTTSKWTMQPSADEVTDAFYAGYRTIDDGDGFEPGFEDHLENLGYHRTEEAPCTCPDLGRHGHMTECRWVREWPSRKNQGAQPYRG